MTVNLALDIFRIGTVLSDVNMNSLSISPSAVRILGKVAHGVPATLSELASKLRLPPTKIRSDIYELEQNGLAKFDPDNIVVHITPKGLNAYDFVVRHPEIIGNVDQFKKNEIDFNDLDVAIDQALEKKRVLM
jgi:DNA-binding MarR family transcriptional regulator